MRFRQAAAQRLMQNLPGMRRNHRLQLMAKATMNMPGEFLRKISKLGDKTDEIVERVLEAGAEVVVNKVRSNLQSAIGKDTKGESKSTGELLSALGVSPVKLNRKGNHDIKVGFREPRSDGGSNSKIANILEHGTSKQAARPFLKPAKTASRKQAIDTMKAKLEEEISGL